MKRKIEDYYKDEWLQPLGEFGSLTINPDPENRKLAYIRGSAYFKEQARKAHALSRFQKEAIKYVKLANKRAKLINTTCVCKNTVWVKPADLLRGYVMSCGCLRKQVAKETIANNIKKGNWGTGRNKGAREAILIEHDPIDPETGKHAPSPTRRAWYRLMHNCPKDIRAAEDISYWWSFSEFVKDMGVSPYEWPCHVGKIDADKPLGQIIDGRINAEWREGKFDGEMAVRQGNWHLLPNNYK